MEDAAHRAVNKHIRAFFDELAEGWEIQVCAEHGERLARICAGFDMAPGSRVLDVGAGTGVLLPILAPRVGGDGFVVEIDLAAQMLAKARARGATCLWACLQADAMDLPFDEGSFDWILCNSCFPHFSDQHRAVAELARSLRRGGRMVICHTQSREAINDLHHRAGGVVGGHELPEAPGMKRLIAGAGLLLTRIEDAPDRYVVVAAKPPCPAK